MIIQFLYNLKYYFFEMVPALAIGFFLSGIIHEFVSTEWVEKHLGGEGLKAILYSTIIGAIVPVCCWGSLPMAITLYLKGASLGPVFTILIATPATSINAFLVVWRFFGIKFAAYVFFSVILMGLIAGLIGNRLKFKPKIEINNRDFLYCETEQNVNQFKNKFDRIISILKYAYITLPKEVGLETLMGLILAALISTITPVEIIIKKFLYGIYGYLFAVIFGLSMYMCATMSVPLVYALVENGLNIGAGLSLLLIGPITSYGTILVIRKEFGIKILLIYLLIICLSALSLGYLYSILK